MARTRTLLELRTEIYERADVEQIQITPDAMDRMINASLAKLYRLLVGANKDFFLESDEISVVIGTSNYDLPSDFWRVLGVDIEDSGKLYPMRRFNYSERNQYQNSSVKRNTRYRVMGNKLRLRPTPTWSGTITLWYIPAPEILDADEDTWDGYAGFEDYAVVDCLIKIREQMEEDVQALLIEKKDLEGDIRASAAERDDAEPDRVRDVDSEYSSDFHELL